MKCNDCGRYKGFNISKPEDIEFLKQGQLKGESFTRALIRFLREVERLSDAKRTGKATLKMMYTLDKYAEILDNIHISKEDLE